MNEIKLENVLTLALNSSIGGEYELLIPERKLKAIGHSFKPTPRYSLDDVSRDIQYWHTKHIRQYSTTNGIGDVTYYFDLGDDESIIVNSSIDITNDMEPTIQYRCTRRVVFHHGVMLLLHRIHGIYDIERLELSWNCGCEWSASLSHYTHFDADW